MVTKITLVFVDGRVVSSDTSSWEFIDSGGEADIYELKIGNQRYIAKVFTEKQTQLAKPIERIAEILRRLVRLRRRCGPALPRSLVGRGLPLAVGALGEQAVLVFRGVEGFTTIADIVNDEEKLHDYLLMINDGERAAVALDVLKALACLEAADIVHVDVTTSNAALGIVDGRRWVYLFDIEAAAVMSEPDYPLIVIPARDAHYMPVDLLADLGIELHSPDPGELPIPLLPSKLPHKILSWVVWTPTWYGLQLVAHVYAGLSPFQGLPAVSASYWRDVVEIEREKGYPGGWPPQAMVDLGFLDNGEFRELRQLWSRLGDEVIAAFYHVFVVDVAEKRNMPSYTLSAIV
ncbi:MAG TPA: hypothetical protein EYP33_08120 [Pyrodictium sp.]|nr:hypothetical protein [Pyrodictium sp.]